MSRNWQWKSEIFWSNEYQKDQCFFSKQKSSETLELEVDERSENRPSSSDTVIDFAEQSKIRPSVSTSSGEKQFTHVPSLKLGFNYVHLHHV